MLQIDGLREGVPIFKTLGSEVRLKIVVLLAEQGPMNLNEIAMALGLTNSALTSHVRKLEESGIIQVKQDPAWKGNQKICTLLTDQLLLNIRPQIKERDFSAFETEIPLGRYGSFEVRPPCGMAYEDAMAGEDNPSCFSEEAHTRAQMFWFYDGFVEYRIPNQLPENCIVAQITLSFEISSADRDTPARVLFFLEDVPAGEWTTFPNDRSRGYHTPAWYRSSQRQHGFLKMLVINRGGVFLDGVQIAESPGEEALGRSGSLLRFRIETHPEEGKTGGVALYGKSFGHYRQDLLARVHWAEGE